uniref:Uncharacterized protein n=1 Tax=Anguilla anguilla TaxID=7936 RepID=A0A0E9WGU8_ANGAN
MGKTRKIDKRLHNTKKCLYLFVVEGWRGFLNLLYLNLN